MDFEYKYTENCIFKGLCTREKKVGCKADCTIQPEFYYLLHSSNIPEQYKKKHILYPSNVDIEAFETLAKIKDDIENFVKEGRLLYLWSNTIGNSKTTWACKLMKTYLATICIGNLFVDRAWFEYIPSFLLLAKEFSSEDRKLHIEALLNRDLVILDDIGAVYNSQYDLTVLSDVINTRYSNGKSTIFTSNVSPDDFSISYIRLVDRMCSDIVIELRGKGRRKGSNTYERLGEKD